MPAALSRGYSVAGRTGMAGGEKQLFDAGLLSVPPFAAGPEPGEGVLSGSAGNRGRKEPGFGQQLWLSGVSRCKDFRISQKVWLLVPPYRSVPRRRAEGIVGFRMERNTSISSGEKGSSFRRGEEIAVFLSASSLCKIRPES